MLRTHNLGALSEETIGQKVTVAGWVARRRDHGGVAFVDLRDASGIAQVVIKEESLFQGLRPEYVVQVVGSVETRPEGNENDAIPTGTIEVVAEAVTILNTSAPLPFQIDEHVEIGEETRLRHRYLDLRRPKPAANMRLRSEANRVARELLHSEGFVEVETPTLTRSTPEGARDFLVPARLAPGSWYALPQSPQLFKQLLQVGGFEKYYQIARAYRDEDFRADRQPEFTQLDIEMSFVEENDVIALAERIVSALWALNGYRVETPLPRMTYHEAMSRYGTDKPDLRFGLEITELTDYFANTAFRVFQAAYVGAVVMPGGAAQPRRAFDAWQQWARQRGAKGLAYVLVDDAGKLGGPVANNLSDEEREGLAAAVKAQPGDCIFFAAGEANSSRALLGAARVEIGRRSKLIDPKSWSFLWVVDAPLFEPVGSTEDVALGQGEWTAVHHAFTLPKVEFLDDFDKNPAAALGYAYDLVCNGHEIAGGSIRIHRRDLQERVFKVMGIDERQAREKFGFLLEGFKYGAPPHGGIAFGWDRVVSLLAGEDSIREVIAFPKTGGGYDLMTAAPAPITPEQREEAGVDFTPDEQERREAGR